MLHSVAVTLEGSTGKVVEVILASTAGFDSADLGMVTWLNDV